MRRHKKEQVRDGGYEKDQVRCMCVFLCVCGAGGGRGGRGSIKGAGKGMCDKKKRKARDL